MWAPVPLLPSLGLREISRQDGLSRRVTTSLSPQNPIEILHQVVSLTSPQMTEPLLKGLFLRRFHIVKGDAHPHVGLRIDNTARGAKGLLVVEDLDLQGGAERQWVQHVQIAAV